MSILCTYIKSITPLSLSFSLSILFFKKVYFWIFLFIRYYSCYSIETCGFTSVFAQNFNYLGTIYINSCNNFTKSLFFEVTL